LFGKRKGDGIPLVFYVRDGKNGKKRAEDWWKRWRAEMMQTGLVV